MAEWLSNTSELIPLLMKQKDKLESLQKAQRISKEMIENKNLIIFDNGLVAKSFCPHGLTQVYFFGRLVHINARLISKRIVEDQVFLQEADKKCKQLYNLADQKKNDIFCGNAFVICGKYYGAKKEYSQAIHCFDKYFKLFTTPNLKQKFHTECWAVYNYARAVCCFPSSGFRNDAIKRCKEVLSANEVIKTALKQRLKNTLNQLECQQNILN